MKVEKDRCGEEEEDEEEKKMKIGNEAKLNDERECIEFQTTATTTDECRRENMTLFSKCIQVLHFL